MIDLTKVAEDTIKAIQQTQGVSQASVKPKGITLCRDCGRAVYGFRTICEHCIPEEDKQMLAEQDGDEEREDG